MINTREVNGFVNLHEIIITNGNSIYQKAGDVKPLHMQVHNL